jgi:predicted lipoprotein with Yx(FWY)xxD motif
MKALSLSIIGATGLVAAAFVTSILAGSVGGVGAAVAAGNSNAAKVATARSGLGRIIVDGRGRTLYLFEKEKRGRSMCSGACAGEWPPLITHGRPIATGGAKQSLLGMIRRADGRKQVTYAGHAVYGFIGDLRRGQTNGEGSHDFGAGWDALSPAGKKIERSGD